MRIVLLGGNGQVAAEIALLLAKQPGVEVRPVARSSGGSAFLRLKGLEVVHGDVSNPNEARALLDGADVVANFALASGTPRQALARNTRIIKQSFACSPPGSRMVFISTLSVHGEFDSQGRRRQSLYGHMKRANENQVLALAKCLGRKTHVLRLGHVGGEYQNITHKIRQQICDPPVYLPYPQRASNLTSTVTIADALLAVAFNRAGPPGIYDVVNLPQWTWSDVYTYEAARIGRPLQLLEGHPPPAKQGGLVAAFQRQIVRAVGGTWQRELILKAFALLPERMSLSLKAGYSVTRARSEIVALYAPPPVENRALVTPPFYPKRLPGLRTTRELLQDTHFGLLPQQGEPSGQGISGEFETREEHGSVLPR